MMAYSPSPAAPVLPEAVRVFSGLAGYGAALLYAGIGATALLDRSGAPVLLGLTGGASIAWALLLVIWATASLRRPEVIWPVFSGLLVPLAAALTLAVVVGQAMFLPLGQRSLDLTAVAAVVLGFVILGSVGYLRRRPMCPNQPPAGRLLAALALSATLVAAIATPGLAASTAGQFAVPHGEHGGNSPSAPVLVPQPGGHHH